MMLISEDGSDDNDDGDCNVVVDGNEDVPSKRERRHPRRGGGATAMLVATQDAPTSVNP
jgi:hypothetical protein